MYLFWEQTKSVLQFDHNDTYAAANCSLAFTHQDVAIDGIKMPRKKGAAAVTQSAPVIALAKVTASV